MIVPHRIKVEIILKCWKMQVHSELSGADSKTSLKNRKQAGGVILSPLSFQVIICVTCSQKCVLVDILYKLLGKTERKFRDLFQTCASVQMKKCVAVHATKVSLINDTFSVKHVKRIN